MRNLVIDKTVNKERRITVRLTPHQDLELDNISDALKMKRSALIRRMIDNFIDRYYECVEG